MAPKSGPSLAVVSEAAPNGAGMPADHEPVAAAPSTKRSEEAVARLVTFLTGATRG